MPHYAVEWCYWNCNLYWNIHWKTSSIQFFSYYISVLLQHFIYFLLQCIAYLHNQVYSKQDQVQANELPNSHVFVILSTLCCCSSLLLFLFHHHFICTATLHTCNLIHMLSSWSMLMWWWNKFKKQFGMHDISSLRLIVFIEKTPIRPPMCWISPINLPSFGSHFLTERIVHFRQFEFLQIGRISSCSSIFEFMWV